VDRSTLAQALARVRRIGMLTGLPLAAAREGSQAYWLDDALTAETVARLPAGAREVVVEDLTKVFLDDSELRVFIRERALRVRRSISFGGFVVSCRGLCDDEFLGALDDERLGGMIAFNPYEPARGMVA
jgi:hypothetical protein